MKVSHRGNSREDLEQFRVFKEAIHYLEHTQRTTFTVKCDTEILVPRIVEGVLLCVDSSSEPFILRFVDLNFSPPKPTNIELSGFTLTEDI